MRKTMCETYPRQQPCPMCQEHTVEVVGPGDAYAVCVSCRLDMTAEPLPPTLAELLRYEEEWDRRRESDSARPAAPDTGKGE